MQATSVSGNQPDLILKNGRITTLWNERPSATAIAIKDGRFLLVGTEMDFITTWSSAGTAFHLSWMPSGC